MPETDIQFLDLGDSLHQDESGFVYFPFQSLPFSTPVTEMLTSCRLISILPGQIRGQHQHPHKTEWLYVFRGQGRFFGRLKDDRLRQRWLDDHRTLVIIPPGIPHTLRNDGSGPLYLLAWRVALQPGLDEPDTLPEPLI